MMKYLAIAVLSLAILAGSHQISRVECDGSWVYVQRIREKVPDPQRKQCRRCSRLQFHFLCVSQWQLDLSVRCRRKEIQDNEFQHSRRCHWCCRQYIHLPQRQLDLYLGQKRQETQHPFRPIIGKRLRGCVLTLILDTAGAPRNSLNIND